VLLINFKYFYVPEIGYRMHSSQGAGCTVALCDVTLIGGRFRKRLFLGCSVVFIPFVYAYQKLIWGPQEFFF